ncbi:hypothetical protein MMC11_006626 [Xylographa trunciseda]|nr:hypothetical protein [Xylographa trunciseda]
MYSATSLLPQPEATERHKHQAPFVSPSDSSTQLPTKPEPIAIRDNRWSRGKGPRLGNAENPGGDISSPYTEKRLPRLSIPPRSSAPLPGRDVAHLKSKGSGDGQVDGALCSAEDHESYSTGYYCSSDVEKQSELSYGTHSEEGHGLPRSYPDTVVMNTSDELTESEQDMDQHLKSMLVSTPGSSLESRAEIRPE